MCVRFGGDPRERAGVGKLILGMHGALAVNGSRVCFITSLVRAWSRAKVTPNSFLAPAELPVGKWIQNASWAPDIWWGINKYCYPSSPKPLPGLEDRTDFQRSKISQEVEAGTSELGPVNTKWWALRAQADEAHFYL